MLRTNAIRLVSAKGAKVDFDIVEQVLKDTMKSAASATGYRTKRKGKELHLYLKKAISMPTVNKITAELNEAGYQALYFEWKQEQVGPTVQGKMKLVLSNIKEIS